MCGIVGYVGTQQAAPILLEGLSRLEYRGYDSAGVCVEQNGVLKVEKAKGRLQNLIAKTENGALLPGTLGIGHTRWATHGEPNDTNSHPHVSQNGKIAVVHNGIIENYLELREFLQQKGVKFASQTDTEVVAQLMEYCMGLPEVETVSDALYMVLHRIEGAYALGILCSDDPDHVYAARKDAPLLIGFGEGENFIASDVTALVKYTRDVVYMDDGEVAVLGRDGVQVYNAMELPIEKEHHHIDWEISAAEKGGYEHFMLKEIMEEPEALRRAILPRIKDGAVVFDGLMLDSSRYDCIKIIACGSSYHVGMVGKYNLEKLTRMPVEVILASEFRYCSPIVNERTLARIISQSGETLDTMAALREAKSLGARILSIVNVVGSSIARESDDVLYTWAGPEIAVATTKAYSTQMAVLDLLAVCAARAGEQGSRVYPDGLGLDDRLGVVIVIAHAEQRHNAVLRRKRLHLGKHGGAPVAQRLVKPDSQHIGIAAALQDPRRLLHGGAEHPPGLLRVEQLRLLCAQIRRNKQILRVLARFYFLFLFRHVSLPASAKQAGRNLAGKRGPQAAYHCADRAVRLDQPVLQHHAAAHRPRFGGKRQLCCLPGLLEQRVRLLHDGLSDPFAVLCAEDQLLAAGRACPCGKLRAELHILRRGEREKLLLRLPEGGVDERLLRFEQLPPRGHPGRALIAFELLIGLGLCFRRQPLLLKLDPAVIVRAELRCLFPGLRADRGGLGLSVGKDARGNFFNSVHCFTLFCGVTC